MGRAVAMTKAEPARPPNQPQFAAAVVVRRSLRPAMETAASGESAAAVVRRFAEVVNSRGDS